MATTTFSGSTFHILIIDHIIKRKSWKGQVISPPTFLADPFLFLPFIRPPPLRFILLKIFCAWMLGLFLGIVCTLVLWAVNIREHYFDSVLEPLFLLINLITLLFIVSHTSEAKLLVSAPTCLLNRAGQEKVVSGRELNSWKPWIQFKLTFSAGVDAKLETWSGDWFRYSEPIQIHVQYINVVLYKFWHIELWGGHQA